MWFAPESENTTINLRPYLLVGATALSTKRFYIPGPWLFRRPRSCLRGERSLVCWFNPWFSHTELTGSMVFTGELTVYWHSNYRYEKMPKSQYHNKSITTSYILSFLLIVFKSWTTTFNFQTLPDPGAERSSTPDKTRTRKCREVSVSGWSGAVPATSKQW